ncbi:MAG: hypothetical protein CFH34_01747, partial [Alphaproteobacteria bacterium MarineAlpha9_Bin4]
MESEDKKPQPNVNKGPSKNTLEKNIEVAQALNQEELNNLSESSNLEALSPDQNFEDNSGAPTEQIEINNEQGLSDELEGQTISADDLEGNIDNAGPQEGLISEVAEETTNVDSGSAPSEDQLINGSPTQGFIESQPQISEDSNNQNLPPQTSEESGEPVLDNSQNTQVIDDSQENLQENILEPEESIAYAAPADASPQDIQTQEVIIAQNAPEVSDSEGSPQQTFDQINQNEDLVESQTEEIAQLVPEEEPVTGNPSEVFSESEQIDTAENLVGPSEVDIVGNPLEEEQASENIQLAEALNDVQLNPEISLENGNPQEGISPEAIAEAIEDFIPPEEIAMVGDPVQGVSSEAITSDQIELAEVIPQSPREEGVQDYINEVAKSILEEKLEQGLSPQESALAALQAGKDAAKEIAENSEEINQLAFNLGESLINDLNNKIEDIQDTIKEKEQPTTAEEP